MQSMGIGGRDQRLFEFPRYRGGRMIWIYRTLVKMTQLNGVETIDFTEQSGTDRAAENVERMRRDREK